MLATRARSNSRQRGQEWSALTRRSSAGRFASSTRLEGHPYFSTARLWDDGIIETGQTRMVLGVALGLVGRTPLDPVGYGVFRM